MPKTKWRTGPALQWRTSVRSHHKKRRRAGSITFLANIVPWLACDSSCSFGASLIYRLIRWSMIDDRWSLVDDRSSLVDCRWSLVVDRESGTVARPFSRELLLLRALPSPFDARGWLLVDW